MTQKTFGRSATFALAALLVCATATTHASGYKIAVQTRVDSSGPDEVFVASFGSYADLFSGTPGAGTGFTQIAVSPDYKIAGLAFDGKYRMALETRVDTSGTDEVYMASFDTYEDMFSSNTGVGTGFTQIAVSPDYKIAGLAYDGKYRMAVQSRADSAAPNEVYMASFDTYDDLFNQITGEGTGFTQIAVSPDYQIVGLAYDGKYRMAVQSREDSAAPNEVYVASFDTYDDLFNQITGEGTGFTQVAISPDYEIVGFAYEPVPEPASMLVLGGASLLLAKKRSKRQ